jgi:predicted acylesterase/phospholipase RssA
MEFFIEARHALGRTALVFSGGGLLGMFHFGVGKILCELDIYPKIVAGSSAGSICAAFCGCLSKEEL